MSKPYSRAYIGDSVYAEVVDPNTGLRQLKLYTDNGLGEENVIYLEYDAVISLIEYIKTHFTNWKF